ncbi:outer dense fiber protein 2 isoform X3 [Carcharodon carcharias]|uniref:outer dense fiber protein 2 isoform X3 n=1 Tax=Carcharodon carcharias TaxID=13397 RepID=UPI001B7E8D9E|nr:outer dense fiber protein 2 isoform X3 [Carcharodon carcharias]
MLRREMKTRTSPLLHVHVDETTPVHVHVKKSPRPAKRVQQKLKAWECGSLRATSKVKTKVPWIPPGKTSVRDVGYKWEGPTHRLDITPVDAEKFHSTLHLSDLSTDDEEAVHGKMNEYEKKIDCLMNQVGSLKNEIELRKKNHLLEQREEELNVSKRLIEEKEEELAEVTKELVLTEHKNELLQRDIEMMKEDPDISCLEKKHWRKDKDTLLKMLIEAEMDGAAAAKQVAALRSAISKLRMEKPISVSESNLLSRQKELLLQKLETFDATNRSVRQLLKEQHAQETDALRLFEQKEALLEKLAQSEAENARLSVKLQEIENQIDQLLIQYRTEKDNARAAAEFSKSLETTRAHLQGQLRSKEADNNRMLVQIRNFERTISQQKGEFDYLTEQLRQFQKKRDRDKEALKKATRAQKQRAERSEDTVELLNAQLIDKESQLADALSTVETWRSCHNKVMKEKSQLDVEISVLNNRITDLLDQTHHVEDKARGEMESMMNKLQKMSSESTCIKMENETMKANMSAVEEKLTFAQSEMQQLKVSIKRYEGLVDSYKSQLMKTRMEADECSVKLEKAEKENKLLKDDVNKEIEQIEEQNNKTREKCQYLQEENHNLKLKLETLERKLEDLDTQNRELAQVVTKREETIHHNQQRLEDKSRECTSLARQLDAATDDARRQVDQTRERALSKERTTQSKIMDLETQMSRTKTELTQLRRSKEDSFGDWHTIAIASDSGEKFDGLNSIIISMDNRSIMYLHIYRLESSTCPLVPSSTETRDGICTKIEINYSNHSASASKGDSGYNILVSNTEYVVLHHYNHGKCTTDTLFLFGRNLTVSSDIMKHFKMLVDCAEIPDLSIYMLPQESGNCKRNMPQGEEGD